MLATGQWLQGRYRIIRPLGRGGMGEVYLAADSRLGDQPVAIKALAAPGFSTTEFAERWQQAQAEAQMLARLNHPGVARVLDCFIEGDLPCIVMEFVPGETLAERLDSSPGHRLPPSEALALTHTLCEVLAYLHSRRPPVIFRDLKPGNIMLTPEGQVRLIDFGIARFFKPGQTHDTASFGTPGYAAPEQYGVGQTMPQSDIYSLAIVLHQALTGDNPTQRTPFLPLVSPGRFGVAVPPTVEAALARATALATVDRYPDALSFAAALDASPPRDSGESRYKGRQLVGLVWSALLVIVVIAAAGLWLWRDGRADEAGNTPAVVVTATQFERSVLIVAEVSVQPESPAVSSSTPTVAPTKPPTPEPTHTVLATPSRLPLPGDSLTALTTADSEEYSASLSPDQRQLVYMTNSEPGWQLVLQDVATGATRHLTHNGANNFIPTFSPDGRQILFASDVGGDFDLYTIDPAGGEPVRLLDRAGNDVHPSFSPDGDRVLFMSTTGSGGYGIYVLDIASGTVEVVIDGAAQETFPAWTPNGRGIAYQSDEGGSHDIYALTFDGSLPRRLTTDGGRDAAPTVSADGAWVVFESNRDGNYNLYAVPWNGGEAVQLTSDPAEDQVPRFSPDGAWLLYQSTRAGDWDLFLQPFDLP